MSRRVISFDLSPGGIAYAINEIERFKKDFITACNELIKQLTGAGTRAAQYALMSYGAAYTGNLIDSLGAGARFDADSRTGIVRTDCEYAAYVEFGTGIIGEGDHPDAGRAGWSYDINHHGESGWYYVARNRDGLVHWTQGEPAKPFMYNAFINVRSLTPQYTAVVFARL